MIKYRQLIEENFLIDKADSGELVPFVFNEVQDLYYKELVRDYDIERKGIAVPIREDILKARREGFSSLILALFAADDIMQKNPTETDVLSYKDDATKIFRKRYRIYVLSYFARENGFSYEQIKENPNLLEDIAAQVLSVDADDIEIKWNKAHFQCNTASARVGGRGGVRHKILFSEIAFYPDSEKMSAAEMVEATMRQVDLAGGWIFCESTENGVGTYQYNMWQDSKLGRSRFKNRFYGAALFYTPEQIELIKSEYVDMDAFRRDYPMSEEDLFKGSLRNFTSEKELLALVDIRRADKILLPSWVEMQGENSVGAAEILNGQLEALARAHKGFDLYAGIDEAKDIDATVMTVLRGANRSLSNNGGVKGISIDTTRGDWLADWFERNTSYYVKRTKFSRPSKSLMYANLLVVIADKTTSLPVWKEGKEWVSDEHKHFFEQMQRLEKETLGNMLVVHHPKGSCKSGDHTYDDCPYHDDYCDSWALAEDVYIDLNGPPVRKTKPAVPTVPNAIGKLLNRPMGGQKRYGGDFS